MNPKKLVLCMIVKNEAHVIERCLASVLPVIDSWVIVDTGSADGTQEKIKSFFDMVGIPGKLYERPWKDFSHNRSEALELARPEGDYTLMIDADEILEFDSNFDATKFKENLTLDVYNVFALYGGIKYHRPQLTSNKLKFYYRGLLHEYLDCYDKFECKAFAEGFINRPIQDGARSKDPQKYAKDAIVFEEALKGPVDPKDFNRYHFYLAQSYRDSQQWQKAHDAYLKRAELGGWTEEVFYSYFQAGHLKEILKQPVDECIKMYMAAFRTNPWRAEPMWAAAKLLNNNCRYDQAYEFAKKAIEKPFPNGALFVAKGIYDWCAMEEYAISSYWTGRLSESLKASRYLIEVSGMPEAEKPRIKQNFDLALAELSDYRSLIVR